MKQANFIEFLMVQMVQFTEYVNKQAHKHTDPI